jgi:PIF1 helicase.
MLCWWKSKIATIGSTTSSITRNDSKHFLANIQTAIVFLKQLLDIGNSKAATDTSSGFIILPSDFCRFTDSKEELIQRVFLNIAQRFKNHNELSELAILVTKYKDVDNLNASIQNCLPGELFSYKSVDTVINHDNIVNYPSEFVNSMDLPELPHHNLQLKVGSFVTLIILDCAMEREWLQKT